MTKSRKGNGHRLHTLCSYMAMFPPRIPREYIEKYSKHGDRVLDLFSGRGTAPLEACSAGRVGIGSDLNPLAYVLTKAKVRTPTHRMITRRIDALWKEYETHKKHDLRRVAKKIRMIFHPYTLRQLCFLMDKLKWRESEVDNFITAMVLGILHGNSEGYLSLPMPNTFSMSPNYIKGFVEKHKLEKPKRDVFEKLHHKLRRCYQVNPIKGKSYLMDATNVHRIKDGEINLIVCSPPYTRVIRYGQFNWIRLWFLGQDAKHIDSKLLCTQSLPKYRAFMIDVLMEAWRVLKPAGVAVFVIGDVKSRTSEDVLNLGDYVWRHCAEPLGFSLMEDIVEDKIDESLKVSRIWGDKKGRATKTDRIVILQKNH